MRILISILLIFAVSSELINQGTWVSNTNGPFANMTVAQMKRYMGGSVDLTHVKKSDIVVDLEAIPTNFDPRTVWPDCIHPILDQEQCGSCWAFGASESFSDRICIQTNGSVNVVLSPENLVSCDFVCQGCNGGYANAAWDYMAFPGIVTNECFPYTAGNGTAPKCQDTCTGGGAFTRYKAKSINSFSPQQGQVAMYTDGPIETCFDVYEDFMNYTSGVYIQKSNKFLGGHCVKVLGWGVDNGVSYWLAQNSWGPSWGMEGFFMIGTSQCGFDSGFIAGAYAGTSVDYAAYFLSERNE